MSKGEVVCVEARVVLPEYIAVRLIPRAVAYDVLPRLEDRTSDFV